MLGIFLDSETNGLNSQKHRIVEIAFQILDVYSGQKKESFHSLVHVSSEDWKKSDADSLQVNGFKWEEVAHAPTAEVVGEQIRHLFAHCRIKRGEAVFICQNPSFDRIFFSQLIDADVQEKLLWPYHWLDLASMYWVTAIKNATSHKGKFPWETGYSKDKIAIASNLPKEETPHRAMNGVNHLLLCYQAIVGFPGQ